MAAAAPLVGAQTPAHTPTAPATPAASKAPAAPTAPAAPAAPSTPAAPTAPAAPAAEPPALSVDQASYLFGLTFGEQMHRAGITDQVTFDAVIRGLQDGLKGKKTTPADQRQVQAYLRSQMEASVARNQTAAKEFLEKNAHEKGVTTTASGLQYKILAPGDRKAAAVTAADQVTVQYRGKLLDGSEFDSSYSRGMPATFSVNGVVRGWQEALVLMKPGAKWQLFVPPDLAYGPSPRPGIPGGSLLIFEVELVSVKSASAAPSAPQITKPAAKSP
jgi:FKBP-type peptidyl-prolyl cis-trans isomerase FklB